MPRVEWKMGQWIAAAKPKQPIPRRGRQFAVEESVSGSEERACELTDVREPLLGSKEIANSERDATITPEPNFDQPSHDLQPEIGAVFRGTGNEHHSERLDNSERHSSEDDRGRQPDFDSFRLQSEDTTDSTKENSKKKRQARPIQLPPLQQIDGKRTKSKSSSTVRRSIHGRLGISERIDVFEHETRRVDGEYTDLASLPPVKVNSEDETTSSSTMEKTASVGQFNEGNAGVAIPVGSSVQRQNIGQGVSLETPQKDKPLSRGGRLGIQERIDVFNQSPGSKQRYIEEIGPTDPLPKHIASDESVATDGEIARNETVLEKNQPGNPRVPQRWSHFPHSDVASIELLTIPDHGPSTAGRPQEMSNAVVLNLSEDSAEIYRQASSEWSRSLDHTFQIGSSERSSKIPIPRSPIFRRMATQESNVGNGNAGRENYRDPGSLPLDSHEQVADIHPKYIRRSGKIRNYLATYANIKTRGSFDGSSVTSGKPARQYLDAYNAGVKIVGSFDGSSITSGSGRGVSGSNQHRIDFSLSSRESTQDPAPRDQIPGISSFSADPKRMNDDATTSCNVGGTHIEKESCRVSALPSTPLDRVEDSSLVSESIEAIAPVISQSPWLDGFEPEKKISVLRSPRSFERGLDTSRDEKNPNIPNVSQNESVSSCGEWDRSAVSQSEPDRLDVSMWPKPQKQNYRPPRRENPQENDANDLESANDTNESSSLLLTREIPDDTSSVAEPNENIYQCALKELRRVPPARTNSDLDGVLLLDTVQPASEVPRTCTGEDTKSTTNDSPTNVRESSAPRQKSLHQTRVEAFCSEIFRVDTGLILSSEDGSCSQTSLGIETDDKSAGSSASNATESSEENDANAKVSDVSQPTQTKPAGSANRSSATNSHCASKSNTSLAVLSEKVPTESKKQTQEKYDKPCTEKLVPSQLLLDHEGPQTIQSGTLKKHDLHEVLSGRQPANPSFIHQSRQEAVQELCQFSDPSVPSKTHKSNMETHDSPDPNFSGALHDAMSVDRALVLNHSTRFEQSMGSQDEEEIQRSATETARSQFQPRHINRELLLPIRSSSTSKFARNTGRPEWEATGQLEAVTERSETSAPVRDRVTRYEGLVVSRGNKKNSTSTTIQRQNDLQVTKPANKTSREIVSNNEASIDAKCESSLIQAAPVTRFDRNDGSPSQLACRSRKFPTSDYIRSAGISRYTQPSNSNRNYVRPKPADCQSDEELPSKVPSTKPGRTVVGGTGEGQEANTESESESQPSCQLPPTHHLSAIYEVPSQGARSAVESLVASRYVSQDFSHNEMALAITPVTSNKKASIPLDAVQRIPGKQNDEVTRGFKFPPLLPSCSDIHAPSQESAPSNTQWSRTDVQSRSDRATEFLAETVPTRDHGNAFCQAASSSQKRAGTTNPRDPPGIETFEALSMGVQHRSERRVDLETDIQAHHKVTKCCKDSRIDQFKKRITTDSTASSLAEQHSCAATEFKLNHDQKMRQKVLESLSPPKDASYFPHKTESRNEDDIANHRSPRGSSNSRYPRRAEPKPSLEKRTDFNGSDLSSLATTVCATNEETSSMDLLSLRRRSGILPTGLPGWRLDPSSKSQAIFSSIDMLPKRQDAVECGGLLEDQLSHTSKVSSEHARGDADDPALQRQLVVEATSEDFSIDNPSPPMRPTAPLLQPFASVQSEDFSIDNPSPPIRSTAPFLQPFAGVQSEDFSIDYPSTQEQATTSTPEALSQVPREDFFDCPSPLYEHRSHTLPIDVREGFTDHCLMNRGSPFESPSKYSGSTRDEHLKFSSRAISTEPKRRTIGPETTSQQGNRFSSERSNIRTFDRIDLNTAIATPNTETKQNTARSYDYRLPWPDAHSENDASFADSADQETEADAQKDMPRGLATTITKNTVDQEKRAPENSMRQNVAWPTGKDSKEYESADQSRSRSVLDPPSQRVNSVPAKKSPHFHSQKSNIEASVSSYTDRHRRSSLNTLATSLESVPEESSVASQQDYSFPGEEECTFASDVRTQRSSFTSKSRASQSLRSSTAPAPPSVSRTNQEECSRTGSVDTKCSPTTRRERSMSTVARILAEQHERLLSQEKERLESTKNRALEVQNFDNELSALERSLDELRMTPDSTEDTGGTSSVENSSQRTSSMTNSSLSTEGAHLLGLRSIASSKPNSSKRDPPVNNSRMSNLHKASPYYRSDDTAARDLPILPPKLQNFNVSNPTGQTKNGKLAVNASKWSKKEPTRKKKEPESPAAYSRDLPSPLRDSLIHSMSPMLSFDTIEEGGSSSTNDNNNNTQGDDNDKTSEHGCTGYWCSGGLDFSSIFERMNGICK